MKAVVTRKEVVIRDDASALEFDVVLIYDREFNTWDAHADLAAFGFGTQGDAIVELRRKLERFVAAIDAIKRDAGAESDLGESAARSP
jgi:hypothetical protein